MPSRFSDIFIKQWWILVIALLLLAGAVLHNLYRGYADVRLMEEQRLSTQTHVIAESLAQNIKSADQVLSSIRRSLSGLKSDKWAMNIDEERLQNMQELLPTVRSLMVIDRAGRVRYSNRKELIGADLSHRDYYKLASNHSGKDTIFIAQPFKTVIGLWGMPVIRRLTAPDGLFDGLVVATLEPVYFSKLLDTVNYSQDMVTTIIHADGHLFAISPEKPEHYGKNLALPDTLFSKFIAEGTSEKVAEELFSITGDQRMVAMHVVSAQDLNTDKPLVVAATRKTTEIFSGWRAHCYTQILVFSAIAVLSSLVLFRHQQHRRTELQEAAVVNEKLRKLTHGIENSASAVMITSVDGTIEYVNRKFCQLTGYTAEEVLGSNPRILKSETTPVEVFDDLWQTVLSGAEWRGELQNRRKNGELYWSIASISPLRDEHGVITHFIANVEDINDRKNAEATIERLAYYDPLTELPNRRMLQDRLDLALKRSRRQGVGMALLYLDLDGFKHVNDNLGHPAGDCLLKEMALRYASVLRDDDMICRMGGDEFAVILHDVHHDEDVVVVVHKLLESTARPVLLEESEVVVTVSIGIAMYPKNGVDVSTLEKNADIALYHAKSEGKNTFSFFDEELNSASRNRIALEQRLRQVLDKQELLLLYQPKVNLATGKVDGVEALIRWDSPEFGMVSPLRFIPMAEETRMIIPIGEWVLEAACRQQVLWQRQGLPLTMAVNLSSVQFKSSTLIDQITTIMDRTGINSNMLELELTESALVEKPKEATWILEQLRSLGCGVSIDDFGTGYSSLAYLKSFPVTVLKIDRTFVRDLASNSGDRAIAQSVVDLARNLNMHTVAEGAEHQEQIDILKELGCDYVQGFVYSRPVCANELPGVVATINGNHQL